MNNTQNSMPDGIVTGLNDPGIKKTNNRTESPANFSEKSECRRKTPRPKGGVYAFIKEKKMRNRKVQREMRRTYGKEKKLDLKNIYGNKDETPRKAVDRLIRQEKAAAIARAKAAVAARKSVTGLT